MAYGLVADGAMVARVVAARGVLPAGAAEAEVPPDPLRDCINKLGRGWAYADASSPPASPASPTAE